VSAVRRTRTLAATPQELWEVIGDPHHLPRWWPRVSRVEGVDEDAFTEVLVSQKGKVVRADFQRIEEQPQRRVVWAQQIEGTPFARVLKCAETEIVLLSRESSPRGAGTDEPLGDAVTAGGAGTDVTIELRQSLRGFEWGAAWGVFARGGGPLVRRAAAATIEEALDGLERIVG
jgi:uncharacterized protein YndB with AHSA1/START domain